MWLSEEVRFALSNGYELVEIITSYEFDRVSNVFNSLIYKLNDLKIKAQIEVKPFINSPHAKSLINNLPYLNFSIPYNLSHYFSIYLLLFLFSSHAKSLIGEIVYQGF